MPGRKEQRGAVREAAIVFFMICFFVSVIFFMGEINCCLSFDVWLFRESMRAEVPNSPVRRGRRGSFTGREKVRRPRNPARINIVNERRYSFSLKMRKMEMKIRMNGTRRVIEL